MRIIAGVAKGCVLSSVATSTRPTSDRAREGLFSSLASEFGEFSGVNFLDLFGGSGAIGLEALSRGATNVHIVERDPEAIRTIERNFELVKKCSPVGKFQLYPMAAQLFITTVPTEKYHIVYIDPPYEITNVEVEDVIMKLHRGEFLHESAMIALERLARGSEFNWPDGFNAARERKYGAARIYYGNYSP